MKKFLATILCFIYVVASSGATISFHYCMGEFIGWGVDHTSTARCDNCGMSKEKKKGCCNDKHATIQLKKDQLASTINDVPDNHFTYISHQYPYSTGHSLLINDDIIRSIHSPPFIQNIPSFIYHCVFLI